MNDTPIVNYDSSILSIAPPQRGINLSQYKFKAACEINLSKSKLSLLLEVWTIIPNLLPTLDNLRNFFLAPASEVLSFFQEFAS